MEQSFLGAAEPATASGPSMRPGVPGRARLNTPAWVQSAGPWVGSGVALLILSYVIVRWAYTRPSFDSFGWLTWGYQTIHLSLNLGGAPSWKPLPWLFTTPFALFGHTQVTLWMTAAVAMSLAGTIFAGRIAYRVCETLGFSGRPAILAAVVAGLGLLGIEDYTHYILSAQSDPVIVTFVLAAIDCQFRGRPRWAMACATMAALGRPEGWLLLGVYSVWAWRRIPGMRWPVLLGWAVVLGLWFGIPTITNGEPNVSAKLALNSPRQLHHNIILGTIGRFTELNYLPVLLMALGATLLGVWRRNLPILLLAGGAIVWVLVEVAFSLHGWAGLPRYMYEAGAIMPVLAAVLIGWVAAALPGLERIRVPQVAGPVLAVVTARHARPRRCRTRARRALQPHARAGSHRPDPPARCGRHPPRRPAGDPPVRPPLDHGPVHVAAGLRHAHERRPDRPPSAAGHARPLAAHGVRAARQRAGLCFPGTSGTTAPTTRRAER